MILGGEDTGESEVELPQPHEDGLKPDRIPKDMPAAMGTTGADTDTRNPRQTRRNEAVGGASLKRPRFDLPAREIPGSHGLGETTNGFREAAGTQLHPAGEVGEQPVSI